MATFFMFNYFSPISCVSVLDPSETKELGGSNNETREVGGSITVTREIIWIIWTASLP